MVVMSGVKRTISLADPRSKSGTLCSVHAGYAIGVVDEEEARESLHLLEEMAAFADQNDT